MNNKLIAIVSFIYLVLNYSPVIAQPPPPIGGGLVINEVDYDQPLTDEAEFIELKNIDIMPVFLGDWDILLVNGAGGSAVPYDSIALPAVDLMPDDYFVICGNGGNVPNCDMVLNATSNIIQNGDPDALALRIQGSIREKLSYDGDVPGYTEVAGVVDGDLNNAVNIGISRYPENQDLGSNILNFTRRCISPGEPNLPDTSGCDQTVGMNDNQVIPTLTIYPNPADELIILQLPDDWLSKAIEIQIMDLSGKRIKYFFVEKPEISIMITTRTLANGIYMVQAECAKQILHQKLVIFR